MAGVLIGGSLQRRKHDSYGQVILLKARGTPDVLQELEERILPCTLWSWLPSEFPRPLPSIGSHDFVILDDLRGAVRGDGSDLLSKHDYKSVGGSKHSVSSKNSGSKSSGL